jgi:hypothetical protein
MPGLKQILIRWNPDAVVTLARITAGLIYGICICPENFCLTGSIRFTIFIISSI